MTEGLAIQNPDAVKTVLMQLRALGIRISVDDFGSGYSSLGYLRQLPVDTLKIDRSLVVGIERNAETIALVNTVVTMAQQLNLQVVAEGVENASQLELLRSLRCGSVQGYLFAKPLAAEAATELLAGGIAHRGTVLPDEGGGDSGATPITWRRPWLIAAATLLVTLAAVASLRREGQLTIIEPPASPLAVAATAAVPAPVVPTVPSTRSTAVPRESTREALVAPSLRHAGNSVAPESLTVTAPPQRPSAETPVHVTQPAPPVPVSVVHDHIFGNCRGQLVLVGRQLSYVPDNAKSKDGFELGMGTFAVALDGESVKIRTAEKTFRFRAAKGHASTLQTLASALAE